MKVEVIVAGHGGQGVLELANNVSYYFIMKGRHAAFTPSYGPESRGGKVKCYVVGSEEEIDSPIVEAPDFLVVMNIPSMDYASMLKKGGTLLANTSLVTTSPARTDIRVYGIPATDIASGLKRYAPEAGRDTSIAANSVMLGAYLALTEEDVEREIEALRGVFSHFLTDRKAAYIPLNLQAVREGFAYVRSGKAEGIRPPTEVMAR
ncbi:MAG TPA: 2-oxoacid:acceptor oxidoreductase family protein [Nitrososphaerales archaeon]|nr:2-oxoacid:acceptor oxidoreductase family protein [Nitrososphaerales archaeon]